MKKGFTLIELLIVIAIIGLLAGGIVISLSYAQKRGRDTQRIADLNSVATALSAFYADKHIYPWQFGFGLCEPAACTQAYYDGLGEPLTSNPESLVPTYLTTLPQEVSASRPYRYACNGVAPAPSCSSYTMAVQLELDKTQPDGTTVTKGYRITNGEQANY